MLSNIPLAIKWFCFVLMMRCLHGEFKCSLKKKKKREWIFINDVCIFISWFFTILSIKVPKLYIGQLNRYWIVKHIWGFSKNFKDIVTHITGNKNSKIKKVSIKSVIYSFINNHCLVMKISSFMLLQVKVRILSQLRADFKSLNLFFVFWISCFKTL